MQMVFWQFSRNNTYVSIPGKLSEVHLHAWLISNPCGKVLIFIGISWSPDLRVQLKHSAWYLVLHWAVLHLTMTLTMLYVLRWHGGCCLKASLQITLDWRTWLWLFSEQFCRWIGEMRYHSAARPTQPCQNDVAALAVGEGVVCCGTFKWKQS